MAAKDDKNTLSEAIANDVTDTSLSYLETRLTDGQKTAEELAALWGNVDTETLYTTEIIGKNTKRTDILARFSTPELQAQTISQIEQSGNTELQAQLAALMSWWIGCTLIWRLRKWVIDMSKHDITSAPFPPEKIAEIMAKAQELGIHTITSVDQIVTIASTLWIDLWPQQPFITFLQQDTPLSKELASVYLPQIATKMSESMHQFLTSYQPWEKKASERWSVKQLMYTKADFQRKDADGKRNTDNIKSFAGKTLVIWWAVGLVVKWCQRLFGGWKKTKKKKWWFWRMMDGVRNFLMIGGWATVGHRLITGERRWGTDGEVDAWTSGSLPTQKEADDFTKEFTPEQQAAYNETAQAMNDMYTTNAGLDPAGSSVDTDVFWESVFEHATDGKNTMGLVVAMIDKRHGTVESITSTLTVFKELFGKNIHEGIDRAWNLAKDAILNVFWVAAALISDTLAQRILGCTSKEQLKAELEKHPQIADRYDEALRKYLKVISYFQYKQQQLPGAIARQHLLTTDSAFSTLSEEEQHDKIDALLEDAEFVKTTIDPVLEQYTKAPLLTKEGKTGAIQLLKQYNMLDGTLLPEDQKKIERITEEQNEIIQKDDEGDVFLSMQEALQTGNQEQAKQYLQTLTTDIQEHAESSWRASRWSAYMPLLTMFDTDEQTQQRLFSQCGFDQIAGIHLTKLEEINKKPSLTEADITTAKQTVNDYFAMIKELELTSIWITGIFEENGEVYVDIGNTIMQTGESFIHGIRLTFNKTYLTDGVLAWLGNSLQWLAMLWWAVISASIITYPIRVIAYPFRAIWRLWSFRAPPKFPSSGIGKVRKLGQRTVRKMAQIWPKNSLLRTRGLTSKYRTNHFLFKTDLALGRISLKEALDIANSIWSWNFLLNGHVITTYDELLRFSFNNLTDPAQIKFLTDHRDAPRIKSLMQKEFTGSWWKPWQRLQWWNWKHTFDLAKLQTYINLENQILAKPKGIEQEFFKTLFAHSKDEKIIQQLLGEKFPPKLLHLRSTKKIDLLQVAKLLGKHGWGAMLHTGKTHFGLLVEIIEYGVNNKKITNMNTFVTNLLRRRPTITANARTWAEAFTWIEKWLRLDMNKTRFERWRQQSKELLQNIIAQLEKIQKNPRLTTAYQKTIGVLLANCKTALYNFTPQSAKQIGVRLHAGKARVGRAPAALANMFKAFKAAPALRIVGRVVGRALLVGAVVFDVLDLQAATAEADAYDLPNAQRKASLHSEQRVKTGLVIVESVAGWTALAARWASALFAAAGAANTVPVAWQIASAILLAAWIIYQWVDSYYEVDQERKKKEVDFFLEASQCMLTTKQNLIAAIAYERGQTRSFKQWFYSFMHNYGWFSPMMAYVVSIKSIEQRLTREQYVAAWIKALIMLDELGSDPELRQQVLQSSNGKAISPEISEELKSRVDRRYKAMTSMYGTPPVTEQETKHHNGITALSRKIHASKWWSRTDSPPSREQREQNITSDPRFSALQEQFTWHHTDLCTYRANQQQVLWWINAEEEPKRTQLADNLAYFDLFMNYQNYLYRGAPTRKDERTAEKSAFAFPQTPPFDEATVDAQQIVHFFDTRKRKPTAVTDTRQVSKEQFEKQYQISGNIGQQVLYRLCNEIYGYTGPNTLREDPSTKQWWILWFLTDRTTPDGFDTEYTTGIYYDPEDDMLKINDVGAFSKDNKIGKATAENLGRIATVEKLRDELDRHDIFQTKTRLWETTINTELTDRMKRIVREELRRRSSEGKKKTQAELASFWKTHGTDVLLPAQLYTKAIRAGIEVQKT